MIFLLKNFIEYLRQVLSRTFNFNYFIPRSNQRNKKTNFARYDLLVIHGFQYRFVTDTRISICRLSRVLGITNVRI